VEQAPHEKKIIEQCKRQNRPLPKKIANAPDLLIGSEFYYSAFNSLNTCRPVSMGIGPIPWTAINDYAIRYKLIGTAADDFFDIMNLVDEEFVNWQSTKA